MGAVACLVVILTNGTVLIVTGLIGVAALVAVDRFWPRDVTRGGAPVTASEPAHAADAPATHRMAFGLYFRP